MGEHITPKFAHLSIRSETSGSQSTSNFHHANGDDEKASSVPSENNTLEADAWPEPSAPSEQRGSVARGPEEKHKNDSNCNMPRGRGRHSLGLVFGSTHLAGPNVRPFRRGISYGNYRNRVAPDIGRGRNNGYYRQPGRIVNVRPVFDQKRASDKFNVSITSSAVEKSFSMGSEHSNQENRISLDENMVGEIEECIRELSTTYVSEMDTQNNKIGPNQSMGNRKFYRDRNSVNVQSGGQVQNLSSNYDAGPIGRARRSYQRSQQPMYTVDTEHNALSNHTLVANSSIPALLPFHQVAYIINGTPGSMLSAAIQLPQTAGPHAVLSGNMPSVSLTNPNIITGQPSIQHSIATLPHIPVDNLPISILPDVSTIPQVSQSFNRQTCIPNTTQAGESSAEIVDVNQMISYINEVGWKKVNFPNTLREHPSVAAAIRDSLQHFNQAAGDNIDSTVNKTETVSLFLNNPRSDEVSGKLTKSDVVIVEDRVFFVPRNINRTKFLKFVSKLDYIRHHIEYYFSESNIQGDMHLLTILTVNNDVCPLSELLQFNRLKLVSTTESELLDAVASSSLLSVVYSSYGLAFGISKIASTFQKTYEGSIVDTGYARTTQPIYLGMPITISNSDHNQSTTQMIINPSLSHQSLSTLTPSITQSSSFLSQSSTPSSTNTFQPSTAGTVIDGMSIASSPHNLSNYIQTSGYVINPTNMHVVTNAPVNTIYSGPSQTQPHVTSTTQLSQFHQPDLVNNMHLRSNQHTVFTPQLYSQLQAAIVASANVTNQSALFTHGLVNPGVPSADQNTASYMASPYRWSAPGNPAQLVGTYVSTMGNPIGLGNASNPAVFLQLIPGAHPNQSGGYFAPGSLGYPPNTGSLLSRPMVPANHNGMWIPLNTGANATGNMISTPYQLQPYVAFPHGHGNLQPSSVSGTNGLLYSTNPPHSLPTSFAAVPMVRSDASYGNQKISNHINSRNHVFMNQPITSPATSSPINNASISNHSSVPSTLPNVPLTQQTNNLLTKRVSSNTQP